MTQQKQNTKQDEAGHPLKAVETPLAELVAKFWQDISSGHVRILVDMRRDHDDGSHHWDSSSFGDKVAKALLAPLEQIALLDEADGHELTIDDAFRAVAIATTALGKHPSEIYQARRANAAPAPPIPDGWKLVPVEPTQEMLNAGALAYDRKFSDMMHPTPTEEPGIGPEGYCYIAMVKAVRS